MGFKGFMAGFRRGLYRDEFLQLSKDCLGSDIKLNEDLMFMFNFVNGRESPFKAFEFVSKIQLLFLD